MKVTILSVAGAVALVLSSGSALAALAPPSPATGAPGGATGPQTGLYLAVWDTGDSNSDVVNLNYDISNVSLASGNMTPTVAGGAFSLVANPTGAAGNVLQVNFGVVPGLSVVNLQAADFMVLAGATGSASTQQYVGSSPALPLVAYAGVNGIIGVIQKEIANWQNTAPTSPFLSDNTGNNLTGAQNGPLNSGQLLTGQFYGTAVGTAATLYNVTTTSGHAVNKGVYDNGTGFDGFFYVNPTTGDVTYNIGVAQTAPVPLPAAAWLLVSGMLGMVGVGRRRRLAA
jgi:hypothetical protein